LNAITVKHKHPMPVVDELAGSKWFTKLDFTSGYHQICMATGEEYKTAFISHNGLFEFLVMPFGLTNAPATFQSFMNEIFAELLRKESWFLWIYWCIQKHWNNMLLYYERCLRFLSSISSLSSRYYIKEYTSIYILMLYLTILILYHKCLLFYNRL